VTSGGAAASPTGGLGAGAIRELASRHGIRPSKSLGQHFLIDPNLARAIAAEAGAAPGVRIVEVGAGLGSLTVALAASGAHVLAIEFDRALVPALHEVVDGLPSVRVLAADAMKLDWAAELGDGEWTMAANLPYNIATPLVLDVLERVPAIDTFVVTVQREVGERWAAVPGEEGYGAVSVKVAMRARAGVVRRVAPSVFWPRPGVDSVVVRLDRLDAPPVDVDPEALRRVVDAGFAERRKTMRNALVRLGVDRGRAADVLARAGVGPRARAEELDLDALARVTAAVEEELRP
jgi:16S rRNA (adenine1518-N6/adenine1519-N6)-dimethyltransferase